MKFNLHKKKLLLLERNLWAKVFSFYFPSSHFPRIPERASYSLRTQSQPEINCVALGQIISEAKLLKLWLAFDLLGANTGGCVSRPLIWQVTLSLGLWKFWGSASLELRPPCCPCGCPGTLLQAKVPLLPLPAFSTRPLGLEQKKLCLESSLRRI